MTAVLSTNGSAQLLTEHAVLAFPEGRQALPVSVIYKSDVLKRVVGVPAAQAAIAALVPRTALQLWSLYVQQHVHHETVEDLCTLVKVRFITRSDRRCFNEVLSHIAEVVVALFTTRLPEPASFRLNMPSCAFHVCCFGIRVC